MIGVTHLQGLKRKIINKASGGISSNFGNIALLNGDGSKAYYLMIAG
jgi:hypothetical protein